MNPHDQLLGLIAARDASDTFSRAAGWGVLVTHADAPEVVLGLVGPFSEPAAALEHAATQESELNQEGEVGFRCQVHALLPPVT